MGFCPCTNCHQAIADTARVCPHCGADDPFGIKLAFFIAFVWLAAPLAVVFGCTWLGEMVFGHEWLREHGVLDSFKTMMQVALAIGLFLGGRSLYLWNKRG